MHQKLAPDPFSILLHNPKQPLHASNSFKNKVFWKRIIKKPQKCQLYFFFQTQFDLMDKVIKKRGLELFTSRSSGHKTNSENSFIRYVLSDQFWWCNVKQSLSYSKNHIWKFMQANSWDHKLFHFYLSFWIWKKWKGRGKITKIWIYLWNKKSFLDEIKNIFHSF